MAEIKLTDLRQIADEFDATKNYSVGERCVHNGFLYRFTTAHSGAWNDAHVVQVKITEELGNLDADVSDLKQDLNKLGLTVVDEKLCAIYEEVVE